MPSEEVAGQANCDERVLESYSNARLAFPGSGRYQGALGGKFRHFDTSSVFRSLLDQLRIKDGHSLSSTRTPRLKLGSSSSEKDFSSRLMFVLYFFRRN